MKTHFKYGSALPLVVLATACSTGPTKIAGQGKFPTRSIASTEVHSTVDTTTEKFVGTADSPVAEPQSVSVKYSNADLRNGGASFQTTVNVPLYVSTQVATTIQVPDYRDQDVYGYYDCTVKIPRPGTVWTRDPSVMHDGWKRLNRVQSNSEKASALADAVYGLGKDYAVKLIDRGYLRTTPNSWEAFSQAITNAGRAKILLPQHVTGILQTNEYENRTRLGFVLKSGGYDTRPGRCYGYIRTDRVQVGSHPEIRYSTVKTQTGTVQRDLTINVKGGLLLPSEVEEIDFVVSANPDDLQYTGATHNHYQMTYTNGPQTTEYKDGLSVIRSASVLDVTPIERIRPTAPSSLIQDVKLTDEGSSGMKAVVTMSQTVQELLDVGTPAGNFLIRYDITGCKPFLGVCVNFKSVTAQRSVQATSRVQTLDIESSLLKKGTRYKVKVTLDLTSNAYFSGTTDNENSDGVSRR